MEKTFIEMFETSDKKGFKGQKNGNYYYLFPANGETAVAKGIAYWMTVFDNEEDFIKRFTSKERIDAKQIVGIKEMHGDKGTWFSGILFDRDNKKARYVNLYDNTTPSPEKAYQKMVVLKQAEYREREQSPVEKIRASIEVEN